MLPPVPGSGRADAEGLAVALVEALALALAEALAVAPVLALSCTNKTFRLSAKTVPTAKALWIQPEASAASGTVRTV